MVLIGLLMREEPLAKGDPMPRKNRLGQNIQSVMEARQMKLIELARLAEVDSGQLCRVLKGEVSVSINSLERVAAALGVSAGFLLDGEGQEETGSIANPSPPVSDPTLVQLISDPSIAFCLRALGKLSPTDKKIVAKVIQRFAGD